MAVNEELGITHHLFRLIFNQAPHEAAVSVALLHHPQCHPAARARSTEQLDERVHVRRHLCALSRQQAKGGRINPFERRPSKGALHEIGWHGVAKPQRERLPIIEQVRAVSSERRRGHGVAKPQRERLPIIEQVRAVSSERRRGERQVQGKVLRGKRGFGREDLDYLGWAKAEDCVHDIVE
eukprot:CAMPEP_0184403992 /NCGR_PEP_ID=MMETSP0007-20130409/85705_1 /TAXON_ID=97485 /ORGANISM="Prymnesium parvum, Strain Texoma1" /LENGTH=180 /DNA_ID=CAMNT_0026760125 /DNA_START=469 /DNA_END=1012 /DNA_ORIENTATION=+